MINWKVRIKNKAFWLALIPALLMLAQSVAALFGYQLDLDVFQTRILHVVETVFVLLSILGIVNDPTTAGISDSELARTYTKPKVDIDGFADY